MLQAPWLALWPALCIAIVVYGVNMFGDALRDLLDPGLKGGVGRLSAGGTMSIKNEKRTRNAEDKSK